jgi:hypothetical protein
MITCDNKVNVSRHVSQSVIYVHRVYLDSLFLFMGLFVHSSVRFHFMSLFVYIIPGQCILTSYKFWSDLPWLSKIPIRSRDTKIYNIYPTNSLLRQWFPVLCVTQSPHTDVVAPSHVVLVPYSALLASVTHKSRGMEMSCWNYVFLFHAHHCLVLRSHDDFISNVCLLWIDKTRGKDKTFEIATEDNCLFFNRIKKDEGRG